MDARLAAMQGIVALCHPVAVLRCAEPNNQSKNSWMLLQMAEAQHPPREYRLSGLILCTCLRLQVLAGVTLVLGEGNLRQDKGLGGGPAQP